MTAAAASIPTVAAAAPPAVLYRCWMASQQACSRCAA